MMADLKKEKYDEYKKMAEEHADFLCEKVFKPAFRMAFVHGAKHMYDEMIYDLRLAVKKENGNE